MSNKLQIVPKRVSFRTLEKLSLGCSIFSATKTVKSERKMYLDLSNALYELLEYRMQDKRYKKA
jgi:hypothetical protein